MLKFVLILTTWSSGDAYVIDYDMTGETCILRLAEDWQKLGRLTCEMGVEQYAAD